jgi:hypothetical protein
MVHSTGMGLTPLCGRPSRPRQGQWDRKEAAQRRCSDSEREAPSRPHPKLGCIQWGCHPEAEPPVFPLVRIPVLWAWEDLNLRPHPYQWSWAGGPPRRMKMGSAIGPLGRPLLRGEGKRRVDRISDLRVCCGRGSFSTQISRAKRCADRHFPRSLASVRGRRDAFLATSSRAVQAGQLPTGPRPDSASRWVDDASERC